MGKEVRRRGGAKIQDVARDPGPGKGGAQYPAGDLAESFRKASKALEGVTRDLVALRRRVTKSPTR